MRHAPTSDIYRAKFNAAMFAGLNEESCHSVARGDMSLSDALGDMDMDDESLPLNADLDVDDDCDCKGYQACWQCIPF